jgi:2-hydroxychromene-2-carboxylate isomerase
MGAHVKAIDCWLDPISPFAFLAFERLPVALEGLSYQVNYRPVLFAAFLKEWGQKGPAEIEPKRAWTFRHVAWLAHSFGVEMQTPATHPFNPLALLRLLYATCEPGRWPNRRAWELVMRHVWRGGEEPLAPARIEGLTARLAPRRDPNGDEVKAELRAATESAIGQGVFGVPTFGVDGRLFWGVDALPMLRAALEGDAWFDGPAWADAGVRPPGVERR